MMVSCPNHPALYETRRASKTRQPADARGGLADRASVTDSTRVAADGGLDGVVNVAIPVKPESREAVVQLRTDSTLWAHMSDNLSAVAGCRSRPGGYYQPQLCGRSKHSVTCAGR
jgi:hypothetical protein